MTRLKNAARDSQRRWRALFIQDGTKHNIGVFKTTDYACNSFWLVRSLLQCPPPGGVPPPTVMTVNMPTSYVAMARNAGMVENVASSAPHTNIDLSVYDPSLYDPLILKQFFWHVSHRAQQVAPSLENATNAATTFLESQSPLVSAFMTYCDKGGANISAKQLLTNSFYRCQMPPSDNHRPRPLLRQTCGDLTLGVHAPSLVYHMTLDEETVRQLGLVL